jgi:hypothetical protein
VYGVVLGLAWTRERAGSPLATRSADVIRD